MARYKATLRIDQVGGSRDMISTTVTAGTIEDLKRKVSGVIQLLEPIDFGEEPTPEPTIIGSRVVTSSQQLDDEEDFS